jgi:hypothetical protein
MSVLNRVLAVWRQFTFQLSIMNLFQGKNLSANLLKQGTDLAQEDFRLKNTQIGVLSLQDFH